MTQPSNLARICVYVCMYVYVYVYIDTHTHTHIYIYTHTHTYTHLESVEIFNVILSRPEHWRMDGSISHCVARMSSALWWAVQWQKMPCRLLMYTVCMGLTLSWIPCGSWLYEHAFNCSTPQISHGQHAVGNSAEWPQDLNTPVVCLKNLIHSYMGQNWSCQTIFSVCLLYWIL